MIFGAPGTENIDFWYYRQKVLIFGAPGLKTLNFVVLGTESIDFWCSRDRKY